MGTIRESIESAFVAVAFAERNRPDEAVWQLRGSDDATRQDNQARRTEAAQPSASPASPAPGAQSRTATAGQRQRPVLRAE
ncbi:hypothetical protein [Nitratidesulfovibrio sp. SRB-5]|uniref:hypothetical protein n=1 Tax=Nitratidesulfovibrio sp. SRB-5 TaxID=2872636 RepID=UPI0010252A0A|nr:hypothetical protein [Nitratidesulfovibrio sp. SRB-5]MBZ2173277.1 hypothetical protein [Nitratidesulfovibrio sp. SRB-5]RXF77855.1 hypothetical protein EKK70_04690 [Desulfovibrio sp. DS-1]